LKSRTGYTPLAFSIAGTFLSAIGTHEQKFSIVKWLFTVDQFHITDIFKLHLCTSA
jgi:hypothetical protein